MAVVAWILLIIAVIVAIVFIFLYFRCRSEESPSCPEGQSCCANGNCGGSSCPSGQSCRPDGNICPEGQSCCADGNCGGSSCPNGEVCCDSSRLCSEGDVCAPSTSIIPQSSEFNIEQPGTTIFYNGVNNDFLYFTGLIGGNGLLPGVYYSNMTYKWAIINNQNSPLTMSYPLNAAASNTYEILTGVGPGTYTWSDGYQVDGQTFSIILLPAQLVTLSYGSSSVNFLAPNTDFVVEVNSSSDVKLYTTSFVSS